MAELSNIYRDPLSPNMGGLYHSIRLIPTDDIEYYPVVVDGFVEFAIIPKEGKTITKWDITRDSGEVSCKLSGPEGGRFWRNTLSFSMPRSSAITQLEGVDLVAIAKDRNGQSRLIGTMDRPAKLLKMESRSGKKAVEGGKYTFEISAINDEEAWIYGDKEFPIPLFAFKSQKIGTINISVTGGSGWYYTTAIGEEISSTNVLSWQRNEADTDTIYLYNSNGLDLSAITTLTASNNIHFGDYDFSEFTNLKTFNWAGNGQDSVILPDNRFKLEGDTIDVTNSFFTGTQFGALLTEIRRVSDTQSVVNRSLKVGTIEDPNLIEVGSIYYDDYVYLQSIGWSINVVSNLLLTATIGANGFIAPGGTISNEGQLMFRVNGEIASNVGSSGEVIEFEVKNDDVLQCWYANVTGDLFGLGEVLCNEINLNTPTISDLFFLSNSTLKVNENRFSIGDIIEGSYQDALQRGIFTDTTEKLNIECFKDDDHLRLTQQLVESMEIALFDESGVKFISGKIACLFRMYGDYNYVPFQFRKNNTSVYGKTLTYSKHASLINTSVIYYSDYSEGLEYWSYKYVDNLTRTDKDINVDSLHVTTGGNRDNDNQIIDFKGYSPNMVFLTIRTPSPRKTWQETHLGSFKYTELPSFILDGFSNVYNSIFPYLVQLNFNYSHRSLSVADATNTIDNFIRMSKSDYLEIMNTRWGQITDVNFSDFISLKIASLQRHYYSTFTQKTKFEGISNTLEEIRIDTYIPNIDYWDFTNINNGGTLKIFTYNSDLRRTTITIKEDDDVNNFIGLPSNLSTIENFTLITDRSYFTSNNKVDYNVMRDFIFKYSGFDRFSEFTSLLTYSAPYFYIQSLGNFSAERKGDLVTDIINVFWNARNNLTSGLFINFSAGFYVGRKGIQGSLLDASIMPKGIYQEPTDHNNPTSEMEKLWVMFHDYGITTKLPYTDNASEIDVYPSSTYEITKLSNNFTTN